MHRLLYRVLLTLVGLSVIAGGAASAQVAPAVQYEVTFPEPEHHWLQVEMRVTGLGAGPLDVRMSRSSPGRYAVHEFAKNVFSVAAYDGAGRPLRPTRPDADVWRISGHDGTARVVYRIFGDYADGTYMAVDTTHAHLNMPATFMWAEGLEARAIEITFTPPAASGWSAGTQLLPTGDPTRFTAPNLQYFMDSPTELARLTTSTFAVPNADGAPARFRVMVHGEATQANVDALAVRIERVVREAMAVFGEFPSYESGRYTFLLDLVAWARPDAMEHRNSTYISLPGTRLSTPDGQAAVLDLVSHEFFHNWNIERIRPVGIEPFEFTRENVTCCLWLGEGFTQYYGELILARAGLQSSVPAGYGWAVARNPARQIRSAVEMSEHAPFADGAVSNDVTDESRTFISYYEVGAAIALGLDLTLRTRSDGQTTLDDYMRRLWVEFGKPADPRPGYVARPYTLSDLRRVLADLTGDATFANDFFDRYVEGHDVMDYAALLSGVGYTVIPPAQPRGWAGGNVTEDGGTLAVGLTRFDSEALVPFGTPLYAAGVDAGDRIVSIDGQPATMTRWLALSQRRPGERVSLIIERRDGQRVSTTMTLAPEPAVGSVMLTDAPTAAQRQRRQGWLASRAGAGR